MTAAWLASPEVPPPSTTCPRWPTKHANSWTCPPRPSRPTSPRPCPNATATRSGSPTLPSTANSTSRHDHEPEQERRRPAAANRAGAGGPELHRPTGCDRRDPAAHDGDRDHLVLSSDEQPP